MSYAYDDTAPLLPILKDLWHQHKIPTRLYRAFFYAPAHVLMMPHTVGELRHALEQPRTPRLLGIPSIGHQSILILRSVFLDSV